MNAPVTQEHTAPTTAVGKAAAKIRAITAAAAPAPGDTPAAEAPARVVHPPTRDKWKLADHEFNRWFLTVHPNTRPEDLDLNPAMWVFADHRLHRYDVVTAAAEDSSWWAEYIVVNSVPGFVNCKLLRATDLPDTKVVGEAKPPTGYLLREGGPHEDSPWISERIGDGARMNAGERHRTFIECLNHLNAHPALRKG